MLRGPPSPIASSSGRIRTDTQGQSPQWSETDFPPLHGFHQLMNCNTRWIEPREIQEVEDTSEKGASDSPSSLSVQPATPVPPLGSNGPSGEETQGDSTNPRARIQELTIPPTPEFSASSLTVTPITPRTVTSFPRTPQSVYMRAPVHVHDGSATEATDAITPKKGGRFGYHHEGVDSASEAEGKSLDPLTIFVGGLEMFGQHAWDEGKLWELFGKHGEVENVQLVKPRRWSCELLCSFYIINALQHSKQEKRVCICDVREFRSEQSCSCC